jgi:hypothetical protein
MIRLVFALGLLAGSGGCATTRPWEREALAQPSMDPDPDPEPALVSCRALRANLRLSRQRLARGMAPC